MLAAGAVVTLVLFGGVRSVGMLAVGLASAAVSLAAAFWFLAMRGVRRWAALAVLALSPIAALILFALAGLLWVAAVSGGVWVLAGLTARAALAPDPADWKMPERRAEPRAAHPFLIMNPRSGGHKVEKFDLKRAAERLGAEVYLMTGRERVDVAAVARNAVANGADLLGVAGGDGTQAVVAGVAADAGVPFMVISAGTRNHFALDLGLDRENPAAGLSALDDGVDLRVDLGRVGTRTFVNNASFGAYAEVVQSPAYRDDKIGATLNQLPELLTGRRGARLKVRAGEFRLDGPQAVLIANNPYGTGDLAGLGRRSRLDRGKLAVAGVNVDSARQAAGLLRGRHSAGLSMRLLDEVTVDAEEPSIPVGVDGEAVVMPTPVHCVIRPGALRVRVPRVRPGVPVPKARMDWASLRRLAGRARAVRPGYEAITNAAEIADRIRQLSAQTVIIDVEPFVASWDSSQQALDQGIAHMLDQVKAIPGVRVVCFATNSARMPSAIPDSPAGLRVDYQVSARKPARTAPYQDMPRPGVVIGDQIVTDGILARRLRFTFLHVRQNPRSMPTGPRLLAGLGQVVRPLVFGLKGRS